MEITRRRPLGRIQYEIDGVAQRRACQSREQPIKSSCRLTRDDEKWPTPDWSTVTA